MRIVLNYYHVDWSEFANEVEDGKDSDSEEFASIADAAAAWDSLGRSWTNGKTGWYVEAVEVFDDAGERHYFDTEEDFPDADFTSVFQACQEDEG